MTKPNSSEIVFVIDRSGSMSSISGDMEGGFNEFIKQQKEVQGECKVTLVQFDDSYDVLYSGTLLENVPPLKLEPRGSTALLDAVGRTIHDTGVRLAAMNECDRPSQVLFVIITDGHENASREYKREKVFDMITHQREKYSWEFVFLGANQDAIATATSIGISATNSVTYDQNSIGTKTIMSGLSSNVKAYRSVGAARADNVFNQDHYDALVNKSTQQKGSASAGSKRVRSATKKKKTT
jgi:uncharacterized protein YegL